MAIRNLQSAAFADFRGGRQSAVNLLLQTPEHALIVRNIMQIGDGVPRKRPGYTAVLAGLPFNPTRLYHYQRTYDRKDFLFLAGGGHLGWAAPDGSVGYTELSGAENPAGKFNFLAPLTYIAFGSDGYGFYKFIDTGDGKITKRSCGIAAPAVAAGLTIGAGSLNLTYGRQYAYSWVEKWTDSLGVTHYHVGPPAPLSASTGPVVNGVPTLQNLQQSTDPKITHLWIWATVDFPANSTSTLYFAAELAAGTTSWGDTLSDDALDQTRTAPYDNQAPPAAAYLLEYNSRVVALVGNLVQFSALEEVSLGIPAECFPPALSFPIPGGVKTLSGACVHADTLYLATPDFWWSVTGYDAQTFVKHDKVQAPGPVGFDAVCTTPTHIIWLGKDKKLWAWDGTADAQAIDLSRKIAKRSQFGADELSMEDMSEQQLANATVRYYSFGQHTLIVVAVSTQTHAADGAKDWVQVWDAGAFLSATGYRALLTDGSFIGLAESDFVLANLLNTMQVVTVKNFDYLYLASFSDNKVWRWPDGYLDDGQPMQPPVFGHVWIKQDVQAYTNRNFWCDFSTDRPDAKDAFQVLAAVGENADMRKKPVTLELRPFTTKYGVDPTIGRAMMNKTRGAAVGRMARFVFIFPNDDAPAALLGYKFEYLPVGARGQQP